MKEKVIKNPNSKLGRKDWDGRSPRYRWSITMPTAMILKEWAESRYHRGYWDKTKWMILGGNKKPRDYKK